MGDADFYSIDRLVEFGLSLGVATQMAQSMNVALREMTVPGAGTSLQTAQVPKEGRSTEAQPACSPAVCGQAIYYVSLDGNVVGPLSVAELSHLSVEKRVTRETYVWSPGMPGWQLAESVPEVLRLVALTPPPVPGSAESGESKSR